MKIDLARINSSLSHYSSYARQQIGELITKEREYSVKIIQLTSDYLQNPKYAKGGVVFANIAFLCIALETAYIADTLFDRFKLTDASLSKEMIRAKCIALAGIFVGTYTALNVGFSKMLAPNITGNMHVSLVIVTCIAAPSLYASLSWLKS